MIARAAVPAFGVAFAFVAVGGLAAQSPREMARTIDVVRATGRLELGGRGIAVPALVVEVYERRSYAPVWSDADGAELVAFLRHLRADGLVPQHYDVDLLASGASSGSIEAAPLDVLRTTALLAAAYDLRFGRVDQATLRRRGFDAALAGDDAVAAALAVLPPAGRAAWEAQRPDNFVYDGMRRSLAELRELAADGGWRTVPSGSALELGVDDPRVAELRVRLSQAGDLRDADPASTVFDERLDAAVRSFQHRHGLNPDGVVGPATLAALNVPVEARIDQLRVNLERARWLADAVARRYVAVNAAGALAYLIEDGRVAFETRVIVGTTATRTPTFSAAIRHIELNPTWTVPPGIVGEVLARIRRDAGYLGREGIRVLDGAGRVVDPGRIDFSRYTARTFPYVFRQEPGPANPLGVVKFVFPNQYHVYLHDTPSRELFEREERLFSHGCIRVQDPLRLAELVLDSPEWTREALRDAVTAGTTRVIPLPRPMPVLILYWTAAADLHGELHFYRDVYGRDPPLLRALDAR